MIQIWRDLTLVTFMICPGCDTRSRHRTERKALRSRSGITRSI